MDSAGGFRKTVGHDRAGADDNMGKTGIDHFAQHFAHFCHGHRPGDGDHDGAIRIGRHGR